MLGGCGILNSVSVSVFACPKTSVTGSVLALKYTKIGKDPHFIARSANKLLHFTSSQLPLAILDGDISSKKRCVVLF